ncbi:hypothetical protein A3F01_04605 [Candidatus Woesebacteria bacterium RIFCSPHIGHO2_12_FULL_38_11]|nr:MAG: hypothetical protein A3F01_04605 [Candidatus Woesebacteria bacterium RIFCSPHIGHO2_12_FULL_38_11]
MGYHLSKIDEHIARFYAKPLFQSALLGESQLCVWFPASGKSTVSRDIASSKKLQKEAFGMLYGRIKLIFINCLETQNATSEEIIKQISKRLKTPEDSEDTIGKISQKCKILIENGQEILIIIDAIDELSEDERKSLLLNLSKIVQINKRRIHTVINTVNKFAIEKTALENPSVFALLNKIIFMPVISGSLLYQYLDHHEKAFGVKLNPNKKKEIEVRTGGILFLTREIIRSSGDDGQLELKLQSIWNRLPPFYKDVLKKYYLGKRLDTKEDKVYNEIQKLGIGKMAIFKEKLALLEKDTDSLLKQLLTQKEKEIFTYFKKNKGRLVPKDRIASILWRNKVDELYSDWAIDKTISRLREKLIMAGFGNDCLITLKGKGYRWLL